MRKIFVTLASIVVMMTTVAGANASHPAEGRYGQYAPYGNQSNGGYEVLAPPVGYDPVFFENVGRHGSRTSTSATSSNNAIKLWDSAKSKNAVTEVGLGFGSDAKKIRSIEARIGYGKLSKLGKAEWFMIGRRIAQGHPAFFNNTIGPQTPVDFYSSDASRAKASVQGLRGGIVEQFADLNDRPTIEKKSMLHFSTPSTTAGTKAASAIRNSSASKAHAKSVLERLYKPSFVATISDPVGKARDIWDVYAISAGLVRDGAPHMDFYVTLDDAEHFAYVNDAEAFYRYGPGLAGTNAFKSAVPVRDNFFRVIDAHLYEGAKASAVFRIGHGETIMPFAALLDLPGSERQALASQPYSYDNNPWRGDKVAKMAANVDWAVYKQGSSVLVTMRYNEQPIRFSAACAGAEVTPYFYDYAKLKKCVPRS